ncbi:MAG TPA: hypothetical protein VI893_03470, partial [Thermoplasmata archaeon]|nr:hypothetical protein [Thermoplasmata archaeon]
MRFFSRPRTLKDELQVLFLAVGSVFLVLAAYFLFQNGQTSLRSQMLSAASVAAETASALIAHEDHDAIRSSQDAQSGAYRTIFTDLSALRRASPKIVHLYSMSPIGPLGEWGVVVDMGRTDPDRDERHLVGGRLQIGSLPPANLPLALIQRGTVRTVAEILDFASPGSARVIAVSPIRASTANSIGIVVVELGAVELAEQIRMLWYVSIMVFMVGLIVSIFASNLVSRW